MIQVVFAQ